MIKVDILYSVYIKQVVYGGKISFTNEIFGDIIILLK